MSTLRVFSDFDNTMVRANTAQKLVAYYLLRNPRHEPLWPRLQRFGRIATRRLRRRNIAVYFDILGRIPRQDMERVLAGVPANPSWLRAVTGLRTRRRATVARVTVITRNCLDVVRLWVLQHRDALRAENIIVDTIIANQPLPDQVCFVRSDLTHIDYVGFGQMREEEKIALLDRKGIFIGDGEEELLRPYVKEFVRV